MQTLPPILTPDHPDPTLLTVLHLFIVVAAVVVATPLRDASPELPYQLRLVDIPTDLGSVKEEGRMDVVPHIEALLYGTDVTRLMLEDRVTFPSPDQSPQIVEHVFHPQTLLRLAAIVEIDSLIYDEDDSACPYVGSEPLQASGAGADHP